ncbi:uncharacterized protein YALI1_C18431g [Yarrowia lipolytica]|uniref:Uncharacterized protein n=1 Tax=Yarrowia lipolytica TaxID=4952 RepID=A0A1D8NAY4_YARLL|nr:hypothetical protein YALI1_C18431g [Yarrowia lipolytica]
MALFQSPTALHQCTAFCRWLMKSPTLMSHIRQRFFRITACHKSFSSLTFTGVCFAGCETHLQGAIGYRMQTVLGLQRTKWSGIA